MYCVHCVFSMLKKEKKKKSKTQAQINSLVTRTVQYTGRQLQLPSPCVACMYEQKTWILFYANLTLDDFYLYSNSIVPFRFALQQ